MGTRRCTLLVMRRGSGRSSLPVSTVQWQMPTDLWEVATSDKNTFRSAPRPCTTAFGLWWVRRIEAGTQVQRLDHLKSVPFLHPTIKEQIYYHIPRVERTVGSYHEHWVDGTVVNG